MDKIRLGIIGCGKMMKAHAVGIHKFAKELEITALCDVNIECAKDIASALDNKPYVTSDFTTMIDYIDAVLVVLPHDLHYEVGMFFALNGKHILMEKPLCNSEEECVRLVETCEKNGVVLMCGYPVRFWPGVIKLKELVDSGEYGKIIQMSIWTEQYTRREIDEKGVPHWGYTARLGGGQLFSHGCHYIDILLWFLGKPVCGGHLGTTVGTEWLLREGTSAVIMKFESGALGYHGATWGARGTHLGYTFQIHTEKGMLEYDHHAGEVRQYTRQEIHTPGEVRKLQHVDVLWSREGEKTKNTEFEILHFADCIKNGKKPLTNGRDSIESLRVIWKMYDAEKHNTLADLSDIADLSK